MSSSARRIRRGGRPSSPVNRDETDDTVALDASRIDMRIAFGREDFPGLTGRVVVTIPLGPDNGKWRPQVWPEPPDPAQNLSQEQALALMRWSLEAFVTWAENGALSEMLRACRDELEEYVSRCATPTR